MLSSIASALADAGKAPDVAESAAHRAVTLIEEQTGKMSLEGITNEQIKKMTGLAQVWDCMSWTAFKAGDLPLAEKYAQAAWMLAQEPTAADHLGQIYEKEGNAQLALDSYNLAKARGYPPVPGLDDRINALEKRTAAPAQEARMAQANCRICASFIFRESSPSLLRGIFWSSLPMAR
jgi:tetratricopeptide (TPR) repeat protein